MAEITNRKFRAAMEAAGLEKVKLWKQDGYFHIYSDDDEMSDIINCLYSQGIYRYSFNQASVETWVKEIGEMVVEGRKLREERNEVLQDADFTIHANAWDRPKEESEE